MATEYPYMISNNKIKPILDSIESAGKPPKFSHVVLKKLGYSSSNDRAVIPLLKRLGFLREDGSPTEHYDELKDKTQRFHALGNQMQELYSELYAINTEIHNSAEEEIKGAISRITGKDATSVGRYYATFKALASIAKFGAAPKKKKIEEGEKGKDTPIIDPKVELPNSDGPSFHYNIQIHLPATTDISVYNAIFKSLKNNLGF